MGLPTSGRWVPDSVPEAGILTSTVSVQTD